MVRVTREAIGRQRLTLLPALLLPLVLAACASSEPAPRDRFFVLDIQVSVAPQGPPLAASLRVSDLASRGFLGGRQIVFRTREDPLEVQRYPNLLWEEPPGRALAGELAQALRAAELAKLVLTAGPGTRSDYQLGGELLRFEHQPTALPPRVEASFTLTLIRERDRRTLFFREYAGIEPTEESSPDAMVRAFRRLSGRLISQAVRDLQRPGNRRRRDG